MASSSIEEIDSDETPIVETDRREQQYKDFLKQIKEIGDEKILQIFIIVAMEIFDVPVASVENIQNFSKVYELIERAGKTKDVAPFIVHEIIKFIESIKGLDSDMIWALKEKARAAIRSTDKVDIKREFPNLEFVTTVGVIVSSMEENEYERFHEHIANNILSDSQRKIERHMIIHELIQRKHLNLKPNNSNDTRETTQTIDETVPTTEDVDPELSENIEKFSKWLDQSNCTTNWDFIVKYCKRNGIKPPKKGIVIGKKKMINLVTLVVSAVTIICLLLAAFILVIIFYHESSENTIEINTYQNQTLLLMSYNSQTISINVSLNVEETSTDLDINVYTSNTVPHITLQDLPQSNLPNLSSDHGDHGSHYNYNYMDGDIPIFLQKGSSINYTLHFTSTCTGVIVTNNSATLYLFDNVEDYKHFKSKHSNVPVAISHFDSIDNLFWSFSIKYDSLYYVGLQIEDCCLVSGNVTVTQASYESSTLRQVCKTLDVSRPYCVIDLPHHFTDCDNKGHVFVSIPAGDASTKISYRSKFYYFSCIFALIAVPLLIGLLLFFIVIVPCVYVCKYSCNFCRRPADYNSLNSSDSN